MFYRTQLVVLVIIFLVEEILESIEFLFLVKVIWNVVINMIFEKAMPISCLPFYEQVKSIVAFLVFELQKIYVLWIDQWKQILLNDIYRGLTQVSRWKHSTELPNQTNLFFLCLSLDFVLNKKLKHLLVPTFDVQALQSDPLDEVMKWSNEFFCYNWVDNTLGMNIGTLLHQPL